MTLEEILTPHMPDEWHEDVGAVLWFRMPICEPPYCGDPLCSDWPFDEKDDLCWTYLPDTNEIQRRYQQRVGKRNQI